jgi:hypothetical protein
VQFVPAFPCRLFRPLALDRDGAQDQSGDGHNAHEDLHQHQALMGGGSGERAVTAHGAPNRNARSHERHQGGGMLAETERRPDHEGKYGISQRVKEEDAGRPGEHQQAHGHEAQQHAPGLVGAPRPPRDAAPAGPGEQQRGDHQVS